jgi:hypothetical protein
MRPVQVTPTSRGGARTLAAAIVALALACVSLGGCGGSSNSGTTVTSGSSVASSAKGSAQGASQGASSSSAARTISAQTNPVAASGAPKPKPGGAAAGSPSYSLAGGCLLVGSVKNCNLPRSLLRHQSAPAIKSAIAQYVACLHSSNRRSASCRAELVANVVLHAQIGP